MKARCGQEDCDCGHTIERLLTAMEGILDCHIRSITNEAWWAAQDAIEEASNTPSISPKERAEEAEREAMA